MSDQLSSTFAALADPTRRAILARLASGEASVTELAKPFDMSMPAISKHLKVLERAGLIAHGREAQWRPRRLEPTALKEVHDWVGHYRQFWEQSFDRLDAYLHKLKQEQPTNENLKTDAPKLDSPAPHGSKKEKVNKEKKHVRNQRTK
jgi:DNA-binding transcriptional ArsR family regulator